MLITEIEQMVPVLEKIQELNEKKQRLLADKLKSDRMRNFVESKETETKISALNSQMSILRDSLEYVRFKSFLMVVKSYLTPEQYLEVWERADQISKHYKHFSQ